MIADARLGVARVAIVLVAVGVGLTAVVAPVPAAIGAIGVLGALWVLSLGPRVTALFLGSLAVILIGYAFFDRAFAYVGYAPLYVGELVLVVGGLAFLYSLDRWRPTRLHLLLLAFMAWGAIRTIPYIPQYGVDALRDAVGWLYAAYAIFLSTILLPEQFGQLLRLVRRVIPWFLVWVPVAGLIDAAIRDQLPEIPGTNVPILTFKGGDAAVLLAGVAAFVLLGLYNRVEPRPRFAEPVLWVVWLAGAGVVSIVNRGGMVATSAVLFVLLFVRQSSRWLGLAFTVALLFAVGLAINPRVDLGTGREFSFNQIAENVGSIVASEDPALQGTKDFRLRWWGAIVSYTVDGPYFWTGKGYGVNLADDDGFQPTEDRSLRSPHNSHVEVLARMGVPGLVLWILFQVAFAGAMLSAAARARAAGRTLWVQVIGWLFVAWAAAMINASFDPYLQGPQGGIWYWAIVGLGLAAIRAVREDAPEPLPEPPPSPGSDPVRLAPAGS
jgi:O-antigen ligase